MDGRSSMVRERLLKSWCSEHRHTAQEEWCSLATGGVAAKNQVEDGSETCGGKKTLGQILLSFIKG
jgi:hypothetical protein